MPTRSMPSARMSAWDWTSGIAGGVSGRFMTLRRRLRDVDNRRANRGHGVAAPRPEPHEDRCRDARRVESAVREQDPGVALVNELVGQAKVQHRDENAFFGEHL